MADYEWEQLLHKTSKLSEAPIFIDDTPGLSILELRAKARRLAQQHDIKLLIIDYLQLMSGGDANKNSGGNREQEIASISRALKGIAKELNIPVIALSHKKPQLSDLRESGSIEQDADMVMFLYRPEYYGITQGEDGAPLNGTAEVIIAKHRNGKLDSIQLKFIGKFTKFADLDVLPNESYGSSFPSSGNADSGYTITMPSKGGQDTPAPNDDPMPF